MSKNTRIFISWKLNPKGQVAYKENFRHPFVENLLPFMGKLVSEGVVEGVPCDGACDNTGNGKIEDHFHVGPSVGNVKASFDAYQASRPVEFDFAKRKLDGVANHVASLDDTNPGTDVLGTTRPLYEAAAVALTAMKLKGATDFKEVAAAADELAEKAHEIVLTALSEKAEKLIANFSGETREGYERQRLAAVISGGREGIRQLHYLVDGWEAGAERLANWGKRQERTVIAETVVAEPRANRDARRRANGYRSR